jgi:hypothetical protein
VDEHVGHARQRWNNLLMEIFVNMHVSFYISLPRAEKREVEEGKIENVSFDLSRTRDCQIEYMYSGFLEMDLRYENDFKINYRFIYSPASFILKFYIPFRWQNDIK